MLDIEWSLYYKSINIYDKHMKFMAMTALMIIKAIT